MKTITLGRILPLFAIGIALLGSPLTSHASRPTPAEVVPVGDNTFSITYTGKTAFSRDTDKMRTEVREQATQYCAAQGKQLKILELTSEKPPFSLGYASAKIVFKAVTPGEVEATPAASASVANPSSGMNQSDEHTTPTDELYRELMKLDELHQKGILTDKEFKAEKKKVLDRSK
ncbi:MAG: SHOCT domain-containing protein [Lacunisphaera sp.]